ncbi:replication initiation protein [Dactylosporangium fulvum]|uniref:Replication initiation protein n=2 Tax=Dactylosporangium fulvum TaxID=53359 RepID=A0ABY5WDD7_9ACTN|nr:replication initiation protein [Dactylosporangium fulvum]
MAEDHGVCTRPVLLRRTDLATGQTEVIDLPCGATREDKCKPCAKRARRLRQQQCREGWHRTDEPLPAPDDPTGEQLAMLQLRAHFVFERNRAEQLAEWDQAAELEAAIGELDQAITESGMRGRLTPVGDGGDEQPAKRRVRSTRRRQDAPDLPRLKVAPTTVGRTYTGRDGTVFQPSTFLTLTLDTYGRVRNDGTPVDPSSYDYRRAAWDAVHFPALLDRFWQNLRRACGRNVQYFGCVEPQRRLAPHAHFAMRGTVTRDLLRKVTAATYHQVWWPPTDVIRYPDHNAPVWEPDHKQYVDPQTGEPLPTWDDALDQVDADPDAEPVHVARFGPQVHAEGVLGGTRQADKLIGYLTKYLTKSVDACHEMTTDRQTAHLERFWAELRYTPCSPRCANWLRYGVQPKNARPNQSAGRCKAKVHQRTTLGMGGRRVLVSRQWSGKTLADHRADTRAWVRAILGISDAHDQVPVADGRPGQPAPFAWEMARNDDPDVPPLQHRLLRSISARIQQRAQLRAAIEAAQGPPDGSVVAAPTQVDGCRAASLRERR